MPVRGALFNALIRTHHITSRKKISKLKQAAVANDVIALIRSGGSPGIMYVEGAKVDVEDWVSAVQKLRYKDYQLAAKPAPFASTIALETDKLKFGRLSEIESVKDFAEYMRQRGLLEWWRVAMGYTHGHE